MKINIRTISMTAIMIVMSLAHANSITGHSGFIKLINPETNGSGYFCISLSSLFGPGAVGKDSIIVKTSNLNDYFQSTNHASFLISLGNYIDLGAKGSFVCDSRDSLGTRFNLFKMNNIELGIRMSFKRTGFFRSGMYLYGNIPVMKDQPEHFYDGADSLYYYDHRKFSDEFLYNPKASIGGKLITSFGSDRFRVILNGGYLFRTAILRNDSTKQDEDILPDALTLGGGMEYYAGGRTILFLEWDGEKLLKKGDISREEFPQRAGGGFKFIIRDNLSATAGGFGALDKGIDAPEWQAYLGMTFSGNLIDPDTDKDGIIDDLDKCPNEPEDFDGYQDEDGCPDNDNDGDGVSDLKDKCPNESEDLDGYKDEDGCPDDDNDGDGIKDSYDNCPNDPEDFDGYEDMDGCPENDNDKDGIPDNLDKCPNEPEDFDGWMDTDGCPDYDNDGDGISDEIDKCPSEAETINGFQDEDGCPDAVILKKDERIVLDNIYFKLGSAELETESFASLNSLKKVFLDNRGIVIQIEGHTDSQGSEEYNLNLSNQRANTVAEYIVNVLRISASQISSIGYGESKPIASNKTSKGRAQNRRIEFRVISTRQ
ncbi:MAG: OmpA family protein [Candidatus Delongbacteria bacterium]|nr:OmpA family protein [Candidatus Delongbacteria bacterium]MCG2760442.1 OmpA family protein [Candidatus Delongbacteria bacterium]